MHSFTLLLHDLWSGYKNSASSRAALVISQPQREADLTPESDFRKTGDIFLIEWQAGNKVSCCQWAYNERASSTGDDFGQFGHHAGRYKWTIEGENDCVFFFVKNQLKQLFLGKRNSLQSWKVQL